MKKQLNMMQSFRLPLKAQSILSEKLSDNAKAAYAQETCVKMETSLRKYLKVHLLIFGLRLMCIPLEERSPLVYSQLVPYLTISFVVLAASYFYVKAACYQSSQMMSRRLQIVAAIQVTTLMWALRVIAEVETDLQVRLLGYIAILMLLVHVYYYVIRVFLISLVMTVCFMVIFWWGCARHTEKPVLVTSIILLMLIIVLMTARNALEEERKDYMQKWSSDCEKTLYTRLFHLLSNPVLILDSTQLIFANVKSQTELCINDRNYTQRLSSFKTAAGLSLLNSIRRSLQATLEATGSREDYTLSGSSISTPRIYDVVLIDFTYKWANKTLAVVFTDKTQEQEKQERKARARYQSLMSRSVPHELRTLLNCIAGLVRCAKAGLSSLYPVVRQQLSEAKAWSNVLGTEISNMLDYSQISMNEFILHPIKTNMRSLLKRVIKLTIHLLAEKRSSVEVVLDSDLITPFVHVDEPRLEQVLVNALTCSVSRTACGKIELKARLLEDENALMFLITDTGTPFTKKMQGAVQTQVQQQRKEHKKMMGLRLAVTRMIVEQMNGELVLESEEDQETVWKIKIPCPPPLLTRRTKDRINSSDFIDIEERSSPRHLPHPSGSWKAGPNAHTHMAGTQSTPRVQHFDEVAAQQLEGPRYRFLVVDDVELNRYVLKSILLKHGPDISEATNGADAVKCARAITASAAQEKLLIFMDIDMPVMNGIEATRKIREQCKTNPPFIVATTANASEALRSECTEVGMDHFIAKPVTTASIRQVFTLLSDLLDGTGK
jgi:CheY-like chemotaxis protein